MGPDTANPLKSKKFDAQIIIVIIKLYLHDP